MALIRPLFDGNMIFFGTVRGIQEDLSDLEYVMKTFSFNKIAISISPEELEALYKYIKNPEFDYEPSDYEIIYAMKLKEYGEDVYLPHPVHVECLKQAEKRNIPVVAIDMNDVKFTDVYLRKMDFTSVLKHSFRKKRMLKRKFSARTHHEFALEWDRVVNSIDSLREVEKEREKHMARRLKNINDNVLAVVDLERMEGVTYYLYQEQ